MIFLGSMLLIISLVFSLVWVSTEGFDKSVLIGIIVALLSCGVINYDVSTETTTTTTYLYTNDYEKYNLDIDSNKIGKIRVDVIDGTRWGSISKDETVYTFIDFSFD